MDLAVGDELLEARSPAYELAHLGASFDEASSALTVTTRTRDQERTRWSIMEQWGCHRYLDVGAVLNQEPLHNLRGHSLTRCRAESSP